MFLGFFIVPLTVLVVFVVFVLLSLCEVVLVILVHLQGLAMLPETAQYPVRKPVNWAIA